MPQTPAKVNGRAVVIEGVVRESAAGDPVLELRGGGTAKLGEVTFSDEASRALYEAAGQYNGGAARTFLRQYTTSVPLKEYSRSFDLFYRSGLEGLSLESAMKSFDGFAGLIGESRAVAAFNTGMTQRQAKMKAAQSGQAFVDPKQPIRTLASNQEQLGEQPAVGQQEVPVGKDLKNGDESGIVLNSEEGRVRTSKVVRGKSRAPYTGKPGSIYEQVDSDGHVKSRTKYGDNGKPEYRDDLTGRPHYDKKTGKYLDRHRHSFTYNDEGQPNGEDILPIPD